MEFSTWYSRSITEAQDRYKKEDEEIQANLKAKEKNERLENQIYDDNYGSIEYTMTDDEDLLRFEDDGGWYGV